MRRGTVRGEETTRTTDVSRSVQPRTRSVAGAVRPVSARTGNLTLLPIRAIGSACDAAVSVIEPSGAYASDDSSYLLSDPKRLSRSHVENGAENGSNTSVTSQSAKMRECTVGH